jgi:hypothetical protein
VRPLLQVGVPVLFEDGAQVGAEGLLGLEWAATSAFGVRLSGGGAYYPTVEGEAGVLLVALGLHAEL